MLAVSCIAVYCLMPLLPCVKDMCMVYSRTSCALSSFIHTVFRSILHHLSCSIIYPPPSSARYTLHPTSCERWYCRTSVYILVRSAYALSKRAPLVGRACDRERNRERKRESQRERGGQEGGEGGGQSQRVRERARTRTHTREKEAERSTKS